MKPSQPEIAVLINAEAWSKFRHWIDLAGDDEVSCLGLIEEIKENGRIIALLVSHIYLVEQVVTAAETTLNDKAVANLMIQLATEGIDTSRLKCWIHSHATMKVFWSGTDDECCAKLANGSYSVSIVTNLHGDILTRIDVYNPCHMTADKIPTQIHYPISDEFLELYSAEFESKVKRKRQRPRAKDSLIPISPIEDEEELERAFEQGYINIYEYEQLSGQSIFSDVCGG